MSEGPAQSLVRLAAARAGWRLWRNNSGALEDRNGRPVRFGLANDSKALNEKLKSSDLIGWRTVIVTPEMVGTRIAQFVSPELKEPGWTLRPGDARGHAQLAWLRMVEQEGGLAGFASPTTPDEADEALARLTVRGYE